MSFSNYDDPGGGGGYIPPDDTQPDYTPPDDTQAWDNRHSDPTVAVAHEYTPDPGTGDWSGGDPSGGTGYDTSGTGYDTTVQERKRREQQYDPTVAVAHDYQPPDGSAFDTSYADKPAWYPYDEKVDPEVPGTPIGDTRYDQAVRRQAADVQYSGGYSGMSQPIQQDGGAHGYTYTTPWDYNYWSQDTDTEGAVPFPEQEARSYAAYDQNDYDKAIRRQSLGAGAADADALRNAGGTRQSTTEQRMLDEEFANATAGLPTGPNSQLFDPAAQLDPSQIEDRRGQYGPDVPDSIMFADATTPAGRGFVADPNDPTAVVADSLAPVGRGELAAARQTPTVTPDQSGRIIEATTPIFAEGNRLKAEQEQQQTDADASYPTQAEIAARFAPLEQNLTDVTRAVADEMRNAPAGFGTDLAGYQQAQDDYVTNPGSQSPLGQAVANRYANLDSLSTSGNAPDIALPDAFTTPSGQAVVRANDGSGYSSWTIEGADTPGNVLYNDNGNWRAVSRAEATNLQQQGAAGSQFAPVASASGIAANAVQSTGAQPDWGRTLQAAGMIAAAPFIAGGGLAASGGELGTSAIGMLGDLAINPATAAKAIGAAYLFKGTGETLGTTGIIGQGLDVLTNLPGQAGQIARAAQAIPIPQVVQNPLAQFEQIAQTAANSKLGFSPIGIAVAAFNNAVANAPSSDPQGVMRGFFTENPVRYAEQQGLQKAGVEYLLTSTVNLHGPNGEGLTPGLTFTDPVGKFHTIFQQELNQPGATPTSAAEASFTRTNNAVASFLHTYDLLNPLWFAIETPGLNHIIGDAFKIAGGAVTKVPVIGKGAQAVGDVFFGLSRKSGADIATRDLSAHLATMVGNRGTVPDALAELYEIGRAFRAGGIPGGLPLARDYATAYGIDAAHALSMGTRLATGAEANFLAAPERFGAKNADGYIQKIAADLRARNFSPDEMKAAENAYRFFRQTDAPIMEQQAALLSAQRDLRAATYASAGIDLAALNNPKWYAQAITFGADTLRTLFLLPGAPALAIKKIFDEAVRSGSQGVLGVRPADLQLVRTGARFLESRGGALGRIGATIENASTVRQYAARNIPFGPEMARTAASNRAQYSFFRVTDKVLDSLVSSPTQHVRLNAAFQELKGWDKNLPTMAENFANNIYRAFDGRLFSEEARTVYAQEAYAEAMIARSSQDFAALANHYQALGAVLDAAPNVPARGFPVGRASVPARDPAAGRPAGRGAPAESRFTIEAKIDPLDAEYRAAYQAHLDANGGRFPNTAERNVIKDRIYGTESGTPPTNLGSAGAGMNQPVRDAGLDMAAGGGAGYRSPTRTDRAGMRRFGLEEPGQLSTLEAGMGGQFDKTRFFKGQREGVTDGMVDAYRVGDYDVRSIVAQAREQGMAAKAAGDTAELARIEDYLLNHGQAAIAGGDKAAYKAYHDLRLELHGTETLSPTARAARDAAATAADPTVAAAHAHTPGPSAQQWDYAAAAGQKEAPFYRGGVPGLRPQDDVTAQVAHQLQSGMEQRLALPSGQTNRLALPEGQRFTNFSAGPGGTVGGMAIAPPTATQSLRDAYRNAGLVARTQGQQFAEQQAAQSLAGTARGNKIIGNFLEQTPVGELLSRGSVNGQQVFAPVLPFAAFHIHTTQFWLEYFAQHPAVPFAIARAVGGADLDEYGGTKVGNRYTTGLLELSTAAKLAHWAEGMYHYTQDVLADPHNNALQKGAKIAGMGLFGNQAFVRPFDYFSAPAQGVLQSTTNPLPGKKPGQIDKREIISEQGALSPFTAATNLALGRAGLNVPRSIIGDVTNPAQPITNAIRNASIAGVNRLGGTASVKQYDPESGVPYFAPGYMAQQGWDAKRTQAAVGDAMTGTPTTPDGRALYGAFMHQQDMNALQKFSPVRAIEETTGKPIYGPPGTPSHAPGGSSLGTPDFYVNRSEFPDTKGFDITQRQTATGMLKSSDPAVKAAAERWLNTNSDRAFEYNRRAGTGGTDLGAGVQSPTGGYYVESPDQAGYNTARAQIAAKTPVTPESVPFMDYNRTFLSRPEIAGLGSTKQDETLKASLDANARRTGAGLPQEQRLAQIAKEGTLQKEIAPGFTVSDYLAQPGNLFDLEKQYGIAKAAGDTAKTRDIGRAIADVKAQDLAQHPQVAGYFDLTKPANQGGATSTPSTTTSKDPVIAAKQEYVTAKNNGATPAQLKEISNRINALTGQTSPTSVNSPRPSAAAPRSSSGTTGSGSSSNRGSQNSNSSRAQGSGGAARSESGTQQAGNDFFDLYRAITDTREKAAVHRALDNAGVKVFGEKSVPAETYRRALEVVRDAVLTERAKRAVDSAERLPGSTSGRGMTKAEAIAAIDRASGRSGGEYTPSRSTSLARYDSYRQPTTKRKFV